MPIEGHPDDCECCVVRIVREGGKRTREDADLEHFLPPEADADADADAEAEEGEEGEEGGEEAVVEDEDELISNALFAKFEKHVGDIQRARAARQELLSFKSALEEESGQAAVDADASLDEIDSMGIWLPEDTMQGDVNMRTLDKLLTRVDQRGFERSSQQLEFHVAFLKAAARVIYRGSWETEKPAIMRKHGWGTCNSEVLIR